mmetsp:Transcript_10990/g.26512  ORF Transcript_10990/g.26512 Transcript_10990/m.26512 type:complete len:474 (-) Transcript_10990:230-1651(-)
MQEHLHRNGAVAVLVAIVCLGFLGVDLRFEEPAHLDIDQQEPTCSPCSGAMNGTVCGTNRTLRDAADLWKIDGLYYDFRPLFSRHPGSKLPLEKTMGTDASILFQIQHLSDNPRVALEKYQVASELVIGEVLDSDYNYQFEETGFYMTLRSRVREKLQDLGVKKPRQANVPILAKVSFNMVMFTSTWYQISFRSFSPVACVLNLISRLVLTGAAHEAMHGSILPQLPNVQYVYAKSVVEGFLGFPLEVWWQEHVLLHHLHTKTLVDPDENLQQLIPVWRLTNNSAWSQLHSFPVASHAAIGLFFPHLRLIAESWRLVDDDRNVRVGCAWVVLGVLLVHWLPLFVQRNKRKAFLSIFLSSLLASMLTMLAFHVNHLFPEAEGVYSEPADWGERQMATTSNFDSGISAISGGLDMQIEHHLFPMLSYNHQQAVQATIKEVAQEFGLPYRSYSSLGSGLAKHLEYMVELGKEPAEV